MANNLAPGDAHREATLLYKMGRANVMLERHTQAIDCFEKAHHILQSLGNFMEELVVLEHLARTYKTIGEEDKVVALDSKIEAALAAAAKSNDILTLDQLATYYLEKERLSEAKMALEQANTLLEQDQERENNETKRVEVGQSYRSLGRAYEQEQMYDEALASYQNAARLLEARVKAHVYGVIMHDIGDVHREQRQFDQALTYYEKARNLKEHDLVITLSAIADVYNELRQPEKAVTLYEEALEKLHTPFK